MKTITIAILVASSLLPRAAAAQTAEESKVTLQIMQEQLDRLQKVRNAELVETKMRAIIDHASVALGDAVVYGWAFRCGTTGLRPMLGPRPATLDVLIDGLPIHAYFSMHVRDDVRAAAAPICGAEGVPLEPGVMMLVSLRAYASGPHTLAFRLTDTVTGAVEDSPAVTVIK